MKQVDQNESCSLVSEESFEHPSGIEKLHSPREAHEAHHGSEFRIFQSFARTARVLWHQSENMMMPHLTWLEDKS
jgi:hypothetical protein